MQRMSAAEFLTGPEAVDGQNRSFRILPIRFAFLRLEFPQAKRIEDYRNGAARHGKSPENRLQPRIVTNAPAASGMQITL